MKKRGIGKLIVLLTISILLCSTIVSAGFLDWLVGDGMGSSITGMAVSGYLGQGCTGSDSQCEFGLQCEKTGSSGQKCRPLLCDETSDCVDDEDRCINGICRETCVMDADCRLNICLSTAGYNDYCSTSCETDEDCSEDMVCEHNGVCVDADRETCANDFDCGAYICVGRYPRSYCLQSCEGDYSCNDGYVCNEAVGKCVQQGEKLTPEKTGFAVESCEYYMAGAFSCLDYPKNNPENLGCNRDTDCESGYCTHVPKWDQFSAAPKVCACNEDEECGENYLCVNHVCERQGCESHSDCGDLELNNNRLLCNDGECEYNKVCLMDLDNCPEGSSCIHYYWMASEDAGICVADEYASEGESGIGDSCEADADCGEGLSCNLIINKCEAADEPQEDGEDQEGDADDETPEEDQEGDADDGTQDEEGNVEDPDDSCDSDADCEQDYICNDGQCYNANEMELLINEINNLISSMESALSDEEKKDAGVACNENDECESGECVGFIWKRCA